MSDASPTGARITDAYRGQLDVIRANVSSQALGALERIEGVPSDAVAAELVGNVVPLVEVGQRVVVQTTGAYLRLFSAVETGDAPAGDVVAELDSFVGAAARGGVSLTDVYMRPIIGMWLQLHEGRPFLDARAGAAANLDRQVRTDLQLAARNSAGAMIAADHRARGWWRVPSPRACDFCRRISTRLYHRSVLMPIHQRCGCTVEPAYRTNAEPVATSAHHTDEYGPLMGELFDQVA